MSLPLKVNEKCLVRHQDCKRILGGSRICFVACPNSDEIALELEIIRQKLREVNIEPYIAIDQREYQKDIFCEKICTKIIESHFCIVILNDVIDKIDKVKKPNANVYYEYGLMTAFRKMIIPIQLHDQTLAFNIQSLDTLKYTPKDFSEKLEEAIKITLINIDEEIIDKKGKTDEFSRSWSLDLMGLVLVDERFQWRHLRILSTKSLDFEVYTKPKDGRLYFVTNFKVDDTDKDVVLRSKIMSLRVRNYCEQLKNDIKQLEIDANKYKDSDRSNYILDTKTTTEKILYQMQNATILILEGTQSNSEQLKTRYEEILVEEGFRLNFEVMDDGKVRELLSKT